MRCDYCQMPKRILVYRNMLRFTVDEDERMIRTYGKDSRMCLECLNEDLRSEIDFESDEYEE